MKYQDAISEVKKDPSKSFIGLVFRPGKFKDSWFFAYYQISITDLDDPEFVLIYFEGGLLFDEIQSWIDPDSGMEYYFEDDVPEEAKQLYYRTAEGLPDIDNLLSEYALSKLFPDLPDPEMMGEDEELLEFAKMVQLKIEHEWEKEPY